MQSRATSAIALVSLLVVATELQAQMQSPLQSQSAELGASVGLKLQRSLLGAPATSTPGIPMFVIANRLSGTTDVEVVAEGDVELRKGNTSVLTDWGRHDKALDEITARGNVRMLRAGDLMTGTSLRYRLEDSTGEMNETTYALLPRKKGLMQPMPARGVADKAVFEGQNRFRFFEAMFTTCRPDDDTWAILTDELVLDEERDVGTAKNARLRFMGVNTPTLPFATFSLNRARKSGFLAPTFGTTGRSGFELQTPYYFNLAPNYDATITPRELSKRGLLIGTELRYLAPPVNGNAPSVIGETKFEVLPNDRQTNATRDYFSTVNRMNFGPVAGGGLTGAVSVQRVSDANYFRDLSSRLSVASQAYLPAEMSLIYGRGWADNGSMGLGLRTQSFQTLQDSTNSLTIPYDRAPQLTFNASKQTAQYGDFNFLGEAVSFVHPTQVHGVRTSAYPSISMPMIAPGAFLTPKIGLQVTQYQLQGQTDGVPNQLSRNLPILSLDSGLVFERETRAFNTGLLQTLEPRAYYLRVPYRNQDQIPLFDTGAADFNYAQIFSENVFSGIDRISDANQLTLAMTSRLLVRGSGQELVKGTVGQRFYFRDQLVQLSSSTAARTYRSSDYLAALSGRISRNWTADTGMQYNPRDSRTERVSVGARYQPGQYQVLSASYRFMRDQFNQLDLAGQWPLTQGWYGVGKMNYSIQDGRALESIAGVEYKADCWIFRGVLQRFSTSAAVVNSAIFVQLELSGLANIGTNPLESLRRNIPGYGRLNQVAPPINPAYDFFD